MIGKQLGSYEITGLLGKGGMGEVYRARDANLKRDVAIKILPDEFSCDPARVNSCNGPKMANLDRRRKLSNVVTDSAATVLRKR